MNSPRRKRETEWMLKLRTVYQYNLNEKVDICEDDKNMKKFKSDDGIVVKLFPRTYLNYFKGTKHVDITTGEGHLF